MCVFFGLIRAEMTDRHAAVGVTSGFIRAQQEVDSPAEWTNKRD